MAEVSDSQHLFLEQMTFRQTVTCIDLAFTSQFKKLTRTFLLNVNTFSFDRFLNEMFPLGNSETVLYFDVFQMKLTLLKKPTLVKLYLKLNISKEKTE